MLRFGVVGLSGVIVNQGLLMLLHGTIGAPLLLSSLIAIEVSILTNFLLNHTWTWRVPLGEPGLLRRVVQYHAAAVLAAFAGNVIVVMGAAERATSRAAVMPSVCSQYSSGRKRPALAIDGSPR